MQTINPDQKSLTESNELYLSMIENSRDGICITQNSHVTYANKSFCELLGYTSEELIGSLASNVLLDRNKDRVIDHYNPKMAVDLLSEIDCATLVHKNGKAVDIEFTASSIMYDGTAASFISVRDITEQKRMQKQLVQSEQKYRNLVENAQDGIIITQFGKFKYVNLAGATQFRLRFMKDDDNDKKGDFISFYAGDDETNPPRLYIEFYVP